MKKLSSKDSVKKTKHTREPPKVRIVTTFVDEVPAIRMFGLTADEFWVLWDNADDKEQLILDTIAKYEDYQTNSGPDYSVANITAVLREWGFLDPIDSETVTLTLEVLDDEEA